MKILERLEKSRNFWFLLGSLFLFFILRFPSLFEPNWYGDEGVYQVVGMAIRSGRLLYQGIWDNKPPFLYLIYEIFNSEQFWIRLASIIFGALSVILIFKISNKIFLFARTSILVTSLLVIFTGLPILEGNIANAENFMLLPTLGSLLLLLNLKESGKTKDNQINIRLVFLAGLFLGISFLFKIVAIFDFGAFLFFIFFVDKKLTRHLRAKKWQTYEVKKLLSFILGFLIFPLLTALFFLLEGSFSQFASATFFSNIGYVGYGNSFIIPQGLLVLKIIILLAFCYFVFKKREFLGTKGVLALLWFSFSLFNAFFSQRPYTHYLLVFLPSFLILLGSSLEAKRLRNLYFGLVLVSIILIAKNFNFYLNVPGYYMNFLSFETGGKSVLNYQKFFDRMTPVDYELALYIKANTSSSDYIFTWGNNAQLYKLSDRLPPGRYTVAYHITGYKNGVAETTKDLKTKKPKIIVIMPYMNYFPFQLSGYTQKIIIEQVSVYERAL